MRRNLFVARGVFAPILAGLLLAGCSTRAPRDFVPTQLDARLRSVRDVSGVDFPGSDPLIHAGLRTVFVVSSHGTIRLVPNPPDRWGDGTMLAAPPRGRATSGLGVAIDRRGYLLTANHVLTYTSRVQVVRSDGRNILIATARIVWRGNPRRGEPDLALLFVPGGLNEVHVWSDDLPAAGTVLGLGKSWTRLWQTNGDYKFQFYAGSATGWKTTAGEMPWSTLTHTAPSFPGDSGGPLLDAHGRLLAVATQGGLIFEPGETRTADATPYGTGARPNLAWLQEKIEADLKLHPTDQP
jgi:S1-C subfamily serine protease